MNRYELALVVTAKIDDEARGQVVEGARTLITRFGGQVGETEEWGKRKLAYEIRKETEAYYYFIQFESEPACPAQLEGRMRIMENVLRYLIVRKDENDTFKVTPEVDETPAEAAAAPAEAVEETAEAAAETAEAAAETAAEAVEDTAEAAAEAVEAEPAAE